MSRSIRVEYPGAFHHVISRGYHQMNIFFDEQDFNRFLNELDFVFNSHTLVIHAYCLMHNHFHLFTETPLSNLQFAMHRLLSRYASYYKKKYQHPGKVFEKRYTAFLVDSEIYALDLTRYIHLNPVGPIVKSPIDWIYSSYRSYLNINEPPSFLDTNLILNRFHSNPKVAINKLIEHHQRMGASYWFPENFAKGKTILGSKEFVSRIKDHLPEDNSELSGLIQLKTIERTNLIIDFVSKQNFNERIKKSLLIYAFRHKTDLNTKCINSILGEKVKSSTLSCRIKTLLNESLKNKDLENIIKFINSSI